MLKIFLSSKLKTSLLPYSLEPNLLCCYLSPAAMQVVPAYPCCHFFHFFAVATHLKQIYQELIITTTVM